MKEAGYALKKMGIGFENLGWANIQFSVQAASL